MKIYNTPQKNTVIVGPAVAVDTLIFTVRDGALHVLLVQVATGPYKDQWAVPGGLVPLTLSLDAAAQDVLAKKAGIKDVHLEQLAAFGTPDRDVRGRTVSVAYMALVNSDQLTPTTVPYYSAIAWHAVTRLPRTAFDHKHIIDTGVRRLQAKLTYSTIVYALLPREFTLTQMQDVYESILGDTLDKRNFRKKVLAWDIVRPLQKYQKGLRNRPAQLYTFTKRTVRYID